jgi:hypothetical protein
MGWIMGTIVTKIIRTNVAAESCVISIAEDGEEIANGNIKLKLNPDETTNTAWVMYKTKEFVSGKRAEEKKIASANTITLKI